MSKSDDAQRRDSKSPQRESTQEALGAPSLKEPPEFLPAEQSERTASDVSMTASAGEPASLKEAGAHKDPTAWKEPSVKEPWKEPWKEPSIKEPWKEPSVKEPWKEPSLKDAAHKDPRFPKPPTGKWSPNQP